MSEIRESKVSIVGGKHVTSNKVSTPFGDIEIRIGVRGFKSSDGGEIFQSPSNRDEPEGAEAQTRGSE